MSAVADPGSGSPLHRALQLSEEALCLSNPNPRVGCVIVSPDGRVIGEGHTQAAGGPHAEVMALRMAQREGHDTRGATAYVTLEPCSHHGRTPPCCDALIAAGIARVVVASLDPNPRVAGRGIERLRIAGVAVDRLDHDDPLAQAVRELNIGFFSRMLRGRPWVRLKAAISLDGRTALASGESQWITGEAARLDGHAWRARACAVLTGVGTVRDDDPRLDARLPGLTRQPHLVVVDSRLETPATARLFEPAHGGLPRQRWIYHALPDGTPKAEPLAGLATLVACPGERQKVDLQTMMEDLGRREVNELHVEAGHKLNGSLLAADLVDEWLVYCAPVLLGDAAIGLSAWRGPTTLAAAPRLRWLDVVPLGVDVRLRARDPARTAFLNTLRRPTPP